MNQTINSQDITPKQLFSIIKKYKWSILIITLIVTTLSYINTYFKPSIYVSTSIIKVKANEKQKTEDVINNAISTIGTKDVLEEITLLKTFKVNQKALKEVSFKVLYFTKKSYKKTELYGANIPIEIKNITLLNPKVIGKTITLTPTKEGKFTLSYQMSYKSKLRQKIFSTEEFNFSPIEDNSYNTIVSNKHFKLKVIKNAEITEPIQFIINGKKRDIFENLIYNRLDVAQLEKDTSLIKVSFEDTIPERANLYVNALTKSFINYSVENKNTQNIKTLNFITEELDNIKLELKDSEERLEQQQISKNIVEPSVQAALYIKNLSNIEIEIAENKLKKKLIINLINFVQNNYNLDAIAPSLAKLDDRSTLSLISTLQENQILEEELIQEYTTEYPRLKTLQKQIMTIRNKIEYNLKSLRTNIEYENNSLIKRKASYEEDMRTLPSKERELVNIKRNYEVKSKMYEYLLKKKAENKIIQLATFSNYQIIDYAYNSHIPIKPKRLLIFILSIFVGLLLGIILAFIRHARNNYIQSKEDIENHTSLPLYASIPFYKQAKHKLHVHQEVKSAFSESFRTLRTNLQFLDHTKKENRSDATVILLTSTVAGEGKSTISANLATILEMAKYKTIILNFDLRKPTLHKFFDISNERGLSNLLSGDNTLEDIIQSTEFANLDFIPSGPIPKDPSELILSKELAKLFKELRTKYEYIIIDTAPIGIVSDTKTLMQHTDLNLIIIREDYAKKEFLLTLEEMISRHDFKNIGLILNASKAQNGEYGYGYSYEYQ